MSETVAIIGAGPTGLYSLLALASSQTPIFIAVYEKNRMAGVGMPYSPDFATSDMLANIGSIEIPPLTETYLQWLQRQHTSFLAAYGLEPSGLSARGFYPRLLLGMYFRDQFEMILEIGKANGHKIAVRERHCVTDIAVRDTSVDVTVLCPNSRTETLGYDKLIIASGHDWRAPDLPDGVVLPNPWSGLIDADEIGPAIGIIGTSLSGIDAVVAVAGRLGQFERTNGSLTFVPNDPEEPTRMAMMSRGGLLPETDFYCPLPYEPPAVFTPEAVTDAQHLGQEGLLDRLFALFWAEIGRADPAFVAQPRMQGVTADTFATAVFARRMAADPFGWAKRDLEQSLAHADTEHTVPWRYAILRTHEAFSEIYADLSETDRRRFDFGLRRVFVDNYAAVPPLSMERLLALADAGYLKVCALGETYRVSDVSETDGFVVETESNCLEFDTLIDARGQRAMRLQDLPFPTLREQVTEGRQEGAPLLSDMISSDFGLQIRPDEQPKIYLAAISFLMSTQPFVQGLPGSSSIGFAVADAILKAS